MAVAGHAVARSLSTAATLPLCTPPSASCSLDADSGTDAHTTTHRRVRALAGWLAGWLADSLAHWHPRACVRACALQVSVLRVAMWAILLTALGFNYLQLHAVHSPAAGAVWLAGAQAPASALAQTAAANASLLAATLSAGEAPAGILAAQREVAGARAAAAGAAARAPKPLPPPRAAASKTRAKNGAKKGAMCERTAAGGLDDVLCHSPPPPPADFADGLAPDEAVVIVKGGDEVGGAGTAVSKLRIKHQKQEQPGGEGQTKPKDPPMTSLRCAAQSTEGVDTKKSTVHVLYSSDSKEYNAMAASMFSAMWNSLSPERLRFEMIIPKDADASDVCKYVTAYSHKNPNLFCGKRDEGGDGASESGPWPVDASPGCARVPVPKGSLVVDACECGTQFRLYHFDDSKFPELGHTSTQSYDRKELLNSLNFARNFADELILPFGVKRVVYLDVDTIVQTDVAKLYDTKLPRHVVFAGANTCSINFKHWFNFSDPIVKATMRPKDCYINAGVYLMDVEGYAALGIRQRIAELIKMHKRPSKIWNAGVHQSSFVLGLYNYSTRVDGRWNIVGLGWQKNIKPQKLEDGFVLHWNGALKPWLPKGLYRDYWLPYGLKEDPLNGLKTSHL